MVRLKPGAVIEFSKRIHGKWHRLILPVNVVLTNGETASANLLPLS